MSMTEHIATLHDLEEQTGQGGARRRSTADTLVALVEEVGVELWHTPDGDAYITLPVGDHREHWDVRARQVRQWLADRYYRGYRKVPSTQAIQDAIGTLAGRAQFDGPEYPVHVRVAVHQGVVYVDLCDREWGAIEITPFGWRVVRDPPVRFRRPRGALRLPAPVPGGSVEELRAFVNVGNEDDWRLMVSWLIGALRPSGPYPVLLLQGEQGSAKSTTARLLRGIIDPNIAPMRTAPRDERDLMIAARNGWVIGYDNLSGIPDWLSDALCRVATGGGFGTRALYTDADEMIVDVQRPIVANGIDDLARRGDLRDRAIVLYLPVIPDAKRRDERTLREQYEAASPRILGALLDAVSMALRRQDSTRLQRLPRMADFAIWVTAAEPSLPWAEGAFQEAYAGNRLAQDEEAAEYDPVAGAVRSLVEQVGTWSGTTQALSEQLKELVDEHTWRSRSWPSSLPAWGRYLRRIAPTLRALGVQIEFDHEGRGRGKKRIIRLGKHAVVPIVSSVPAIPETQVVNGFPVGTPMQAGGSRIISITRANAKGGWTGQQATGCGDVNGPEPSPWKPKSEAAGDSGDDGDDDWYRFSNSWPVNSPKSSLRVTDEDQGEVF